MTAIDWLFPGREAMSGMLAEFANWTPADAPADPLHIGDIGWHLRFEPDVVARDLVAVTGPDGSLAAVGLRDEPVLRLALAPEIRGDRGVAEAIAGGVGEALFVDVAADTALRTVLVERGWSDDPDVWQRFVRTLADAPPFPDSAAVVSADTAADRVAVQRGSFENSTFTPDRWHAMMAEPCGHRAVDVIVRAEATGEAAAAATGWFAGPGRCALLEPVGTVAGHQGRGHGRTAVLAACSLLAARGATAVAVTTPASNPAAVALYRSAGFATIGFQQALTRP